MPLFDSQILIIVLSILVIISIAWIIRLEFRIKRLTEGTDKKSLESGLTAVQAHIKEYATFKESTLAHLANIETRLHKSVQNVETVRFDPFKGAGHGGSQSFATALLDEDGNGVVISTIHTRERVGVFSKAIKNGTSGYELTPEEKEVIAKARGKV